MPVSYRSLNDSLRSRFGYKLYKIALDGGFTCPNRDGTLGSRGCIFCSGAGSGEFAESRTLSVTEQIERGKQRIASKFRTGTEDGEKNASPDAPRYIAYFQAFTGTYAPVERLRALFTEAILHPDVAVLSVATRPDCLPEDVLELLSKLNRIKPVWIELGLQTIHERTAEYIRRGYPLSSYDRAVKELHARGIEVIVHVILGLPGESAEDMKETVRYAAGSGADGIKLQLLHVIEGTDLADEYRAGKFEVLSREAYTDLVAECLSLLPETMVVHRLTGDGDRRTLIAPQWSTDKKGVLNEIRRKLSGMPA